jgi:amino acid transporter
MKKYKMFINVLLVSGLVWVSLFSLFPSKFSMSSDSQMMVCVLVYCLVGLFLVALFAEKPADEREVYNQFTSSRAAYVVGTVMLASAVVWQDIYSKIDPVIPVTLIVMVVVKTAFEFRNK